MQILAAPLAECVYPFSAVDGVHDVIRDPLQNWAFGSLTCGEEHSGDSGCWSVVGGHAGEENKHRGPDCTRGCQDRLSPPHAVVTGRNARTERDIQ